MPDQVAQRLAQPGIGFDQTLLELLGRPAPQIIRERPAVFLVEGQASLRREPVLATPRVVRIELGQHLNGVARGLGEVLQQLAHAPAAMGQAVAHDAGGFARDVAGQRVAHLHRWGQLADSMGQNTFHVLAGVGLTSEEQHHLVQIRDGHDA